MAFDLGYFSACFLADDSSYFRLTSFLSSIWIASSLNDVSELVLFFVLTSGDNGRSTTLIGFSAIGVGVGLLHMSNGTSFLASTSPIFKSWLNFFVITCVYMLLSASASQLVSKSVWVAFFSFFFYCSSRPYFFLLFIKLNLLSHFLGSDAFFTGALAPMKLASQGSLCGKLVVSSPPRSWEPEESLSELLEATCSSSFCVSWISSAWLRF